MCPASLKEHHAIGAADDVPPLHHRPHGVERPSIHRLNGDVETLLRVPSLFFGDQESRELGILDPVELNGQGSGSALTEEEKAPSAPDK